MQWSRDPQGQVRTEKVCVSLTNSGERHVLRPILEIFEPKSDQEVEPGTVRRSTATCPVTGYTVKSDVVRSQLLSRAGGGSDARLLCVVTTPRNQKGRSYRVPTKADMDGYDFAVQALRKLERENEGSLSIVPNEHLPIMSGVFSNAPIYGHSTWGSLFSPRQLLAIATIVRNVRCIDGMGIEADYGRRALGCDFHLLTFGIGRLADRCSNLCTWDPSPAASGILHTFGRQLSRPSGTSPRGCRRSLSPGGWLPSLQWVVAVIERESATLANMSNGTVAQVSAASHSLPDACAKAIITYPPDYNAVPYADLSDFFYVWFRRVLCERFPDLFREEL